MTRFLSDMAGRNQYGVYDMDEKTCAKCGKVFLPAPFHVFRVKEKGEWYCSWSCYNHKDDKEIEEEECRPKESTEKRCPDCKRFAYCDWDKIVFHKSTGTPCEDFDREKNE